MGRKKKKNTLLLSIATWTSLIMGIFILMFVDMWAAGAFFINALLGYLFLNRTSSSRYTSGLLGIALSVVMCALNISLSWIDSAIWLGFIIIWFDILSD